MCYILEEKTRILMQVYALRPGYWSASANLYACTPVRRTATLLDAKWRNPMTPFWSSRSFDWTQISVLRFPLNESVRRVKYFSEPKKKQKSADILYNNATLLHNYSIGKKNLLSFNLVYQLIISHKEITPHSSGLRKKIFYICSRFLIM